MGAIVGRYGNRIAAGTFSLDGKSFHVPLNNGPNAMHGGTVEFDRKVWTARPIDQGVELTLVSPDGDGHHLPGHKHPLLEQLACEQILDAFLPAGARLRFDCLLFGIR